MKTNNYASVLILFCGLFLVSANCSLTKRLELFRIDNDNTIIICYRIYNPATVPNCVEISAMNLSDERNDEILLVDVIDADSASIEFINNDSLFLEFYSKNSKLDNSLIVDLKNDKFPIVIRRGHGSYIKTPYNQ